MGIYCYFKNLSQPWKLNVVPSSLKAQWKSDGTEWKEYIDTHGKTSCNYSTICAQSYATDWAHS